MTKALLSMSIFAFILVQSCSNSKRETINSYYGVSIATKQGSRAVKYESVEKIEIGEDFIYLFEKDETSPKIIFAKSEILLISILQASK